MSKECKNILDCILNVAPLLNDMTMDDLAVAVAHLESNEWIAYHKGENIDLEIPIGSEVQKHTIAGTAMREGRRVVKKIDAEKTNFGIPYVGIGVPLKDENGEVFAAISLNKSLARQEEMYRMSDNLLNSMREIADTIETLSAESEELASIGTKLSENADQLTQKVEETDEVLTVVQEVTDQTNLLGLNAAIEAARVGDEGKGFGVVAEEIRQLANNTASSLEKIEEILRTLQESNEGINSGVEEIEKISFQQAEEIQSISETIQSIKDMSDKLSEFAKKMV
ncbi:methyl-accepting chemotaxis protein [Fuchsiella alkaliacetigena]|uniref:methyl-accepting chemotaxis protein n=1 Tax=Fuchsiella alkaliacetigena TaxID=957042 RepID=UPI00200AA101|nr:methyl-accepting chemotaxis protein [Fuchsiella alkaliacetigena]MCK8823849.1 methyl-accepting chemotaxis protein [Fuchsiella alkaliacetigena]